MHTKSYLHFRVIYWRYQTILLEMNLNLCINAGLTEMALGAESEGRWFDSNLIFFGKRFVFTPRSLYIAKKSRLSCVLMLLHKN